MHEISKTKKKFLESIGIDINNLPPEFERRSDSVESSLSQEEIDFLGRESLTGRYNKTFCLKDLVGTTHPDYADKTWLEAFLLSKRGDNAVEQYFRNPEYYSVGLKQQDQTDLRHDSPIELYESEGQFYINGGNNRLSLIMMKYLAEMSKAQTDEERAKIDEKYTFVAEVQPIPEDKDIMYMINMIREAYGNEARVQRTANNDKDCEYTIQFEDKIITISSKEDLEQVLRDSYGLERVKSLDELRNNIANLIQDRIVYGARKDQNRGNILNSVFPNLQQFQENFIKLREYGIEDKLYERIDLQNLNLSELSDRASQIVEREEARRAEELQREEEKRVKEEQQKVEAKKESKRKSEQRKKDVAVGLKKDHIGQQTTNIPSNVETTYYELKQEEIKFSSIAQKLGLSYSITKIDDTNIQSGIEQIKSNMQIIGQQVQRLDDPAKLDKVSDVLQELENLTQDGTLITEYGTQLKETFEKSFDAKVQELIKSSKISRLKQERGQVENEKISILGKLLGKGRLKQARLDNLDLKIQLLMSENQSDKLSYSLEDSLSDLYTYSQCKLGKGLTSEMKEFLGVIKTDPQLRQMINQQELKQQFDEKVKNRQRESQLIPLNENGRISNRHQSNILQLQNNELSRQIQNNRARTITWQNNLSSISTDSRSPLNRFQSIVNEINLSTQTREARQQQKTEQKTEMQL